MKITIAISKSTLYWSPEEDSYVLPVMAPDFTARKVREMPIQAGAADALSNFFKGKGLSVDLVYEDVLSQAKLGYWKRVLTNGPLEKPALSVEDFLFNIQDIGLRPIQKVALKKITGAAFSINAAICGTGKTLTTLLNSFYFHKAGIKTLTIIASPPNCMRGYKEEVQKHRGHLEDFSIEEIYGGSIAEMRDRLAMATSDVIVLSLTSLERLVPDIQEKISAFEGQTIFIVEEAHFIKTVSSRRSRGAQLIAPLADRVIVNTATPMPQGPTDIRGILTLVGMPLPESQYANGIPHKDFETLKGITFVSDEEDVPFGELRTEHFEYLDLEELQSKMVEVVQKEILEKKVVVFCSTNEGIRRVWNAFPGIQKTVLSGSYFVDDCADEALQEGRNYEFQQKAIDQFNSDERCRLLIANYKVGSTGVNLQHSGARMAFFFEISNNGADFFQARYRIRRPFVFHEEGFMYYFARSKDARKKRTEDRQFAKLANQQAMLTDIKRHTRGA